MTRQSIEMGMSAQHIKIYVSPVSVEIKCTQEFDMENLENVF